MLIMKATNLNHKTSYIISLQSIKVLKTHCMHIQDKVVPLYPPFQKCASQQQVS
jgi:hypothetical protein